MGNISSEPITPKRLALEVKKLRLSGHKDRFFAKLHGSSATSEEIREANLHLEALARMGVLGTADE